MDLRRSPKRSSIRFELSDGGSEDELTLPSVGVRQLIITKMLTDVHRSTRRSNCWREARIPIRRPPVERTALNWE
jgi:hypothetical protein